MKQISQQEFSQMISTGIVVVDFFATRCGPCKMIAPYLDDMEKKLEGSVQFYKVDVDEERTLAAQQNITAMPTLQVFNNGKLMSTIIGADLQGLRNAIQQELTNTPNS